MVTISKDGHSRTPLAWRLLNKYKCLWGVFQNMGYLFPTFSSSSGISVLDTWYNNLSNMLVRSRIHIQKFMWRTFVRTIRLMILKNLMCMHLCSELHNSLSDSKPNPPRSIFAKDKWWDVLGSLDKIKIPCSTLSFVYWNLLHAMFSNKVINVERKMTHSILHLVVHKIEYS